MHASRTADDTVTKSAGATPLSHGAEQHRSDAVTTPSQHCSLRTISLTGSPGPLRRAGASGCSGSGCLATLGTLSRQQPSAAAAPRSGRHRGDGRRTVRASRDLAVTRRRTPALLFLVLLVVTGLPVLTASAATVGRLAGSGRYETAAAISACVLPAGRAGRLRRPGCRSQTPSRWGGGGCDRRPVLLVNRDAVPAATAGELERLQRDRRPAGQGRAAPAPSPSGSTCSPINPARCSRLTTRCPAAGQPDPPLEMCSAIARFVLSLGGRVIETSHTNGLDRRTPDQEDRDRNRCQIVCCRCGPGRGGQPNRLVSHHPEEADAHIGSTSLGDAAGSAIATITTCTAAARPSTATTLLNQHG